MRYVKCFFDSTGRDDKASRRGVPDNCKVQACTHRKFAHRTVVYNCVVLLHNVLLVGTTDFVTVGQSASIVLKIV